AGRVGATPACRSRAKGPREGGRSAARSGVPPAWARRGVASDLPGPSRAPATRCGSAGEVDDRALRIESDVGLDHAIAVALEQLARAVDSGVEPAVRLRSLN